MIAMLTFILYSNKEKYLADLYETFARQDAVFFNFVIITVVVKEHVM